MSTEPTQRLEQLFEQQKCWTIDALAGAMGYAVISTRRFLKHIGYYRSYSHNGRWYTLKSIPKFNRNGIWRYEQIGFSRNGNLMQTIESMITKSPKGATARQLTEKLHCGCHAVLSNMYKTGRIDRIKHKGQFVYLSSSTQTSRRQRRRIEVFEAKQALQPFSAQSAVYILVEFINHPQLSFAEIAARLTHRQKITVSPDDIERFFTHHGIKKTPAVFR
jgi:hypothetical protein